MTNELIFVTGGARSGKSRFAQTMAQRLITQRLGADNVSVVVTAEALDEEMHERIAKHQAARPSTWQTLEAPLEIGAALQHAQNTVVILDCLSLWVANQMLAGINETTMLETLQDALKQHAGVLIVVSNEVGSGVVPDNALGRAYRDALGRANQWVAHAANTAYLVVAGLPLCLKSPVPESPTPKSPKKENHDNV